MIRWLLILALFFVGFFAVLALSPTLIADKGYLLISIGGFAIESTLVSALIMLVLAGFAVVLLWLLIGMILRLAGTSWQKIIFSGQRRAQKQFYQGIQAFMLADYEKAENLMAKCAEACSETETAWLTAAKAAIARNAPANAKHYLNLIEVNQNKSTPTLEVLALRVQLLIQQGLLAQARHILDENHKLIGHDFHLLKAEIDLCLAEQRYGAAIENIGAARRIKAISEDEISQWEIEAYRGKFNELYASSGLEATSQYWTSLIKKVRMAPPAFLAYANVLATQNLMEPLINLLHPVLKKDTDSQLLSGIKKLPVEGAQPLIAIMQKHLQKNPQNVKWLSALGHMAASNKDWHIAEKAFTDLFAIEKQRDDELCFAYVLQNLGHYKDAAVLYHQLNQA